MERNRTESIIGWLLLAAILFFAPKYLGDQMLLSRLLIGLGIGYTLARASYGFAGIVNRPFNSGSTALTRAFMYLIMFGSLITVWFVFIPFPDADITYNLFVHPINIGTIVGSFMFGFGMAFAGGCASGVLSDLTIDFSKAIIALFFFGVGIIISQPFASKYPALLNESWFTTGERNGVFLPDLFTWDGYDGFLVAWLLTAAVCLIIIYLSYRYEEKRKVEGTYTHVPSEIESESFRRLDDDLNELSFYERVFARPWTLKEGTLGMLLMYIALMGMTRGPWGVSGPFGIWAGKLLTLVGVNPETITNYVGNPDYLSASILKHPISLQDISIITGAVIALLTMGRFVKNFTAGLKIDGKRVLKSIIGGLLMGLSIGISKGCNAGGLFSPLVSFSLSGWVFFIFMALGAISSNKLIRAWDSK